MSGRPMRATTMRTPWDAILSARSNIRVLRVLEQTREAMTVRELARRAEEHLRAAQLAVGRLAAIGIIERVGTGVQQLVRLNRRHPLVPALRDLYAAERERFNRVIDALTALARTRARDASAVWVAEDQMAGNSGLCVGVLADSGRVDATAAALREAVVDLARREHLLIEVRGWTRPDLEALGGEIRGAGGSPILLHGALADGKRRAPRRTRPRSHVEADAALRDRARAVVKLLEHRPELIQEAREEIAGRLATAARHEAQTLREWRDLLDTLDIPQVRRWLVGRSERAVRLRQSLPWVLLDAAESAPVPKKGGR